MVTILLLTISTVFMTFAWYEHLRHKDASMWKLILVSWLIAFLEYCFQVPANRIGSNAGMTGAQFEGHTRGHHACGVFGLRGHVSG